MSDEKKSESVFSNLYEAALARFSSPIFGTYSLLVVLLGWKSLAAVFLGDGPIDYRITQAQGYWSHGYFLAAFVLTIVYAILAPWAKVLPELWDHFADGQLTDARKERASASVQLLEISLKGELLNLEGQRRRAEGLLAATKAELDKIARKVEEKNSELDGIKQSLNILEQLGSAAQDPSGMRRNSGIEQNPDQLRILAEKFKRVAHYRDRIASSLTQPNRGLFENLSSPQVVPKR